MMYALRTSLTSAPLPQAEPAPQIGNQLPVAHQLGERLWAVFLHPELALLSCSLGGRHASASNYAVHAAPDVNGLGIDGPAVSMARGAASRGATACDGGSAGLGIGCGGAALRIGPSRGLLAAMSAKRPAWSISGVLCSRALFSFELPESWPS